MIEINWLALLAAAVSTFIVGFIWYNPKVFGTAWMNETGMTEEKAKGANMALTFGMALVFAFMLSIVLQMNVIHQFGAQSAAEGIKGVDPSVLQNYFDAYGNTYRTFGHGALHGLVFGIFVALPILGTNALFEMKSWKYIFINAGYWMVNLMLMGGIICAWK